MKHDRDVRFMQVAEVISRDATCPRKHVGAVLVLNKNIISTGYNGSADGMPHCDDDGVGCMIEDEHCVRTIHAEANAVLQIGVRRTAGATLYTTASPCWPCFNLIMRAKIKKVVFSEFYKDKRIFNFAKVADIELLHLRTCCAWHRQNPGNEMRGRIRDRLEECRCLDYENCWSCSTERDGCGCDGSMDDGCFLCTPSLHARPECSLSDNLRKILGGPKGPELLRLDGRSTKEAP